MFEKVYLLLDGKIVYIVLENNYAKISAPDIRRYETHHTEHVLNRFKIFFDMSKTVFVVLPEQKFRTLHLCVSYRI